MVAFKDGAWSSILFSIFMSSLVAIVFPVEVLKSLGRWRGNCKLTLKAQSLVRAWCLLPRFQLASVGVNSVYVVSQVQPYFTIHSNLSGEMSLLRADGMGSNVSSTFLVFSIFFELWTITVVPRNILIKGKHCPFLSAWKTKVENCQTHLPFTR